MKGPYRKEIIEQSLQEFPCKYCDANTYCKIKCNMYKSCHSIYNKAGKTVGLRILEYLKLCDTKEQAMEAVLKYNQY